MQVNAATCVVSTLDYFIASLCLAHNTPYIYIKQGLSADDPFICNMLQQHKLGLEMPASAFEHGQWDDYLAQALTLSSSMYRCESARHRLT